LTSIFFTRTHELNSSRTVSDQNTFGRTDRFRAFQTLLNEFTISRTTTATDIQLVSL